MATLAARLKSLWHAGRIFRSGLFDSSAYTRANPDIAGRLPAILHWSLYGCEEERHTGGAALDNWLLSALDQGKISAHAARQLQTIATNSPGALAEHATRHGLTVHDLTYLQALEASNIGEALNVLPQLSATAHFQAAHRVADRHMHLDGLARAMSWAEAQTNLSLSDAVKLADMARAQGRFGRVHGDHILKALMNTSYNRLDQQVFKARWPLIDTGSQTATELTRLGLQVISERSPGRCGELVRTAADLAPLINIATAHAVSGVAGYVQQAATGEVLICDEPKTLDRTLRVRLLMPHYWTDAQRRDRVTGPVLDLYLETLRALLNDGWTLMPVFATPIFNISKDGDANICTLSYHTCSPDNETDRFLHFKEAHLPGYFCVNESGFGGWSSLAGKSLESIIGGRHMPENDRLFHRKLVDKYVTSGVSKYDQVTNVEPDRPVQDYVLATLQIPDDTVNFWAYMPTGEWMETLATWCQNRDRRLIVKRHPHDRSIVTNALMEKLASTPNVYISKAPIHDLIAGCDWLVTTNSGVGFEALLHLKQVVLCGRADYSAAAHRAHTPDDLVSVLNGLAAGTTKISDDDTRHFLRTYSEDHCATREKNLLVERLQTHS